MTSASDVLYVLDRIAIQDLIAKYGLGQDLHQGDNNDQDLTASGPRSSPRTP